VPGYAEVAWSRDGKHLARIGWNDLYIWDETRKAGLPVPLAGSAVAWSPREDLLAFGRWDGRVGVCGADGKVRHEFQAHHAPVSTICWDPQGRYAASCSNDGTLWAWDAEAQALWQAVLLAGGKTATFGPAGELLQADAGAEKHLVYLVERTAGKVELLTAEEFRRLLETSPPEKSGLPARGTKE
jgi:WD40 repeat protein